LRSKDTHETQKALENIKPTGKQTALFDAVKNCLDEFERYQDERPSHNIAFRLIVMTDGGENFSNIENKSDPSLSKITEIVQKAKQLQVYCALYSIGGNAGETKKVCDKMNFIYHDLCEDNVDEKAKDYELKFQCKDQAIKNQAIARAKPIRVPSTKEIKANDTISQLSTLPVASHSLPQPNTTAHSPNNNSVVPSV
jgi:hypothetical protein